MEGGGTATLKAKDFKLLELKKPELLALANTLKAGKTTGMNKPQLSPRFSSPSSAT